MTDSAIWSSASVETPGAAALRTANSAEATSDPAAAMASSSPALRCATTLRLRSPGRPITYSTWTVGSPTECSQSPGEHLVQRTHRVDRLQVVVAVVLEQRLGLVAIHLHPVVDDLFGVIGATAALEPLEQLCLGNLKLQHRVELGVVVLQHLVERLGLLHGAGVAVENEPGSRILLFDAVLDQLVRQLRRHQI